MEGGGGIKGWMERMNGGREEEKAVQGPGGGMRKIN